MKRLPILMVALASLACISGQATTTDQYLDRVRQMHAENREQFRHLTTVTFAVPTPLVSNDPQAPLPTNVEAKQYMLSLLAPRLADLSRASLFLRKQLDELEAMEVPEEYKGLHADLLAMWEAGIAWVDAWLESTQDATAYIQVDDWEGFDAINTVDDQELTELNRLTEQHVNASRRVDVVLFEKPKQLPLDIGGSVTAQAKRPLPDVPTATRESAP